MNALAEFYGLPVYVADYLDNGVFPFEWAYPMGIKVAQILPKNWRELDKKADGYFVNQKTLDDLKKLATIEIEDDR